MYSVLHLVASLPEVDTLPMSSPLLREREIPRFAKICSFTLSKIRKIVTFGTAGLPSKVNFILYFHAKVR
jgi:hypothetical protein